MLDCPKEIIVGTGSDWKKDPKHGLPLAYVTYKKNGKLYKEKSFNSWRNEKIEPKTFDNTAQGGFRVLFNVGGCKSGWNVRQTYFRVEDPRGFEFEITAANFTSILEQETIVKGVLSGKYAYAWESTELKLIPEESEEYRKAVYFNTAVNDKNEKVTKDNIVVGQGYCLRNHENGYYLGRFDWYGYQEDNSNDQITTYNLVKTSMYTFITSGHKYKWEEGKAKPMIVGYREIKNVKFKNPGKSIEQSEVNKYVDFFNKSKFGGPIDNLNWGYEEEKKRRLKDDWHKKYHPTDYMTYEEWVKAPVSDHIKKNEYETARFVVDTGDPAHFKSVTSFKFKNGNIHNYVFSDTEFTPEKITIDDQVKPYEGTDPAYSYYSRTKQYSHWYYEAYAHYHIEEFTETDKLMPCYDMYHPELTYKAFFTNQFGKWSVPTNISKTYEQLTCDQDAWNLD